MGGKGLIRLRLGLNEGIVPRTDAPAGIALMNPNEPESPDTTPAFRWRVLKSGDMEIYHHERLASALHGRQKSTLLSRVTSASEADAQRLMARATGNYKRGNERRASEHPRNR